MRHLLAAAHRAVLERFAWSQGLLALDFDGTLAPIAPRPEAAAMRPSTRALLARAARLYPCVVISGRARADAARRLAGVPVRAVIGNHGAEEARTPGRRPTVVRRWRAELERRLAHVSGVVIEDKRLSLAVHYRACRRRREARAAILDAASSLGPLRLVGGKQVLNLLPAGAPHKGMALERARARLGCDTALYVGDDDTDEDVFSLDQPGRLIGVRVGVRRGSAAAYYLRSQREIDDLLRALVRARAGMRRGAAA